VIIHYGLLTDISVGLNKVRFRRFWYWTQSLQRFAYEGLRTNKKFAVISWQKKLKSISPQRHREKLFIVNSAAGAVNKIKLCALCASVVNRFWLCLNAQHFQVKKIDSKLPLLLTPLTYIPVGKKKRNPKVTFF